MAVSKNGRKISGINIQWPWSQLLITGKKTVETRAYPLPKKFENVPLAIIETPGKLGNKHGVNKARIIGIITFSSSFKYPTEKSWSQDIGRHCVSPDDSQFAFNANKEKWGWVVSHVEPLSNFVSPPSARGIIFASNCEVGL